MAPIERITLFKIPNEADVDRVLEQYKVLAKTATKVCITLPIFIDPCVGIVQLISLHLGRETLHYLRRCRQVDLGPS